MSEIHSGRQKKHPEHIAASGTPEKTGAPGGWKASKAQSGAAEKKDAPQKDRMGVAADAAAVICAILCAVVLCLFGGQEDTLSQDAMYQSVGAGFHTVTYTSPEKPEEWSFWDYLSDVMAGVFGYGEPGEG